MRSILFAGALAGLVLSAAPAFAGPETEDRNAAIAACRAAIAEEAGVPATREFVDFHRAQTRPRLIETRFNVRAASGETWRADCVYRRGAGEIVSVSQDRRAPSFAARAAASE
jgi:hypothetical protein